MPPCSSAAFCLVISQSINYPSLLMVLRMRRLENMKHSGLIFEPAFRILATSATPEGTKDARDFINWREALCVFVVHNIWRKSFDLLAFICNFHVIYALCKITNKYNFYIFLFFHFNRMKKILYMATIARTRLLL